MRRGAGVYAGCRSNRHPSGEVFVQTVNAAETISTFDQLEAAVGTGGTYTLTTYIDLEADLTLTDITLNGAAFNADIYTNGHKLTMEEDATLNDVGVYVGSIDGTGTETNKFNMNGGKITGNEDKAAVEVANGEFIMNDGEITGNDSGAVSINDNGTFTMKSGEISGNQSDTGGGVFLLGGTFTMTGGTIAGNQAEFGAGVCTSYFMVSLRDD